MVIKPEEESAVVENVGMRGLSAADYKTLILEAGGQSPSGDAIGGLVFTAARSDGFQDKGFEMQDLMLKGGMAIGDKQWIGAKFTHYESDANISYRGVFLDAYKAGASFNPAPDDWFLTERNSFDINHEWAINADTTLNTLLYWSEMNRDYWRFGTVSGAPTRLVNGLTQWNYGNSDFQRTNGGKTLHQGLEAAIGYDFGNGFSVDANATWIPDAEFVGNRYKADGSLDIPDGNRVAYAPEWVANLILAYRSGPLTTALSVNHVDEQFTDTANTVAIKENTSGLFTGQVDAYTTVDLTARYAINKQLGVFGAVKNLTDEHYIASLRQGIYVGPERSVEVGARYSF